MSTAQYTNIKDSNNCEIENQCFLPENKKAIHRKIKEDSYYDRHDKSTQEKRDVKVFLKKVDPGGVGKQTKKVDKDKSYRLSANVAVAVEKSPVASQDKAGYCTHQ